MAEPQTVGKPEGEGGNTEGAEAGKAQTGVRRHRFEEEIVPSRLERFIVERTCCAFCTFLGLAVLGVVLCIGFFASGTIELLDRPSFGVRSDIAVQRWHAFFEAKDDANAVDLGKVYSERSEEYDSVVITYKDLDGGNVLEGSNFEKFAKVEAVLLNQPEWGQWCRLLRSPKTNEERCDGGQSLLEFIYPSASGTMELFNVGFGPCGGEDVEEIDACSSTPDLSTGMLPCTSQAHSPLQEDVLPSQNEDVFKLFQCMCCAENPGAAGCSGDGSPDCKGSSEVLCSTTVERHWRRARNFHFGERLDCRGPFVDRARSKYALGYPLPGYTGIANQDDNEDMGDKIEEDFIDKILDDLLDVREEVKTDSFDVWFSGAGLQTLQLSRYILMDQLLAFGSITGVFIWLFGGTGSGFLAVCGILEIVFSLPLATALWGLVRMETITSFMLTVIFLILGVGADDIFVLFDAYQQADTFYKGRPAHEDTELNRFAYALRRARCAMSVTTLTTMFSLAAAGVSRIPAISGFGIFGAVVVFFDFLLVITFFASGMVLWNRYLKGRWGPCRLFGKCCSCCQPKAEGEQRAIERFFKNRWSPFIMRFRKPIILIWFLLGVAAIVVCSLYLRPSEDEPSFFRESYGRMLMKIETDGFQSSSGDERIEVVVVVGMKTEEPIDRSGTNYQDREDRGKPVFDQGAADALTTPAGQLALYNLCEAARNFDRVIHEPSTGCETFVDPISGVRLEPQACQTGVTCFIDWVRDFRMSHQGMTASNWHEVPLMETLQSEWFSPGATCPEFQECCNTQGKYICEMQRARSAAGLPDATKLTDKSWAYLQGGRLHWAYVSFNSTIDNKRLPLSDMEPHFDGWEAFADQHRGPLSVFQTCRRYVWMVTQREILTSAGTSVGTTMLLAFFVLLFATMNWIIAALSFVCIILIVITFAGIITICGWSLGIFEVIGLTVVAGLAVDFSVHIGHSYNEARTSRTKGEKAEHALMEMGVSILSGAGTTLVASVFLLPARFSFFFYFGIFMFITVTISTLISLMLLPALLVSVGPEGDQGDLLWLQRQLQKCGSFCGMCCTRARRAAMAASPSQDKLQGQKVSPATVTSS